MLLTSLSEPLLDFTLVIICQLVPSRKMLALEVGKWGWQWVLTTL